MRNKRIVEFNIGSKKRVSEGKNIQYAERTKVMARISMSESG